MRLLRINSQSNDLPQGLARIFASTTINWIFAMRQCKNFFFFACFVLTEPFSSGDQSKDELNYLDPRYLVPFNHLFLTRGSSENLAVRFINDIMSSEYPKMCDMVALKNDTRPNDPSPKFDIVCIRLNSLRPVAIIGIQPVRFESKSRKITEYEVADHYASQLEG